MFEAKNVFGEKICARCGKKAKLTTDHFIPKSCRMSVDEEGNLVAICESCNQEKANHVVLPSWYVYLNDKQRCVLNRYMRYCNSWIRSNCSDEAVLEYLENIPNA